MTVKSIFDEIAAEPSTNKKLAILGRHEDNDTLKRALYLAESRRVKFYIKQIPTYTTATLTYNLDEAMDALTMLSTRQLTGGAATVHLASVLSLCEPDDAYIIERIILKDTRIGMGSTQINKVFGELIEKTPYMGAKAFDPELVKKLFVGTGKVVSQAKMDGRYANAIIRSGDVELESRQGETTALSGAKFLEELSQFPDCVLNGELTMGSKVSRYESNGIIASLVSIGNKKLKHEDVTSEMTKFEKEHMNYQEALDAIIFTVWDKIEVEEYFKKKSSVAYSTRLESLTSVLEGKAHKRVELIDSRIVESFEEAMQHFSELASKGEEGTVVKSLDGTWKDGKPNWQVKLKKEMNLDLKIVGFNYGTGKNLKVISSIDVQSSDGLLQTSPTGMKESVMQYVTDNQDKLMGTIIEVKCSGISQDDRGEYSVLHPVVLKFRDDKTDANSLDECIKIEFASTFL